MQKLRGNNIKFKSFSYFYPTLMMSDTKNHLVSIF
jgi:hypothetical protein